MKTLRLVISILLICAVSVSVFAQGGSEKGSDGIVEIEYMLWDSNQQPAYEQAAALFMERNPNIKVVINQMGWGDYWTDIPRRMVAGDGPDVFTNHLAFANDFAKRGQILDIQPLVERDSVATDIYYPGLAELWTRDGHRWGLPKDWDTIAVVINVDMFKKAGIDVDSLDDWTWNPQDGGTFEETLRKVAAANPGTAGLGTFYASGFGQQEWSHLAHSTGFTYSQGNYSNQFNFNDPRLADTHEWFNRMIDAGVCVPLEDISALGDTTMFTSKKIAATFAGSWMIGYYANNVEFDVKFVSLPTGPVGKRSPFNGLADAIWSGSENQEEAWQWVKFLGSKDAQDIIGKAGVVFPAVKGSEEYTIAKHASNGIDVSAYTDLVKVSGQTFLFPLTDNAAAVQESFQNAFEKIYLENADASAVLTEANASVNKMLNE